MSLWSKGEKVCGTCIFWNGKRNRTSFFVDTLDSIGVCFCEKTFKGLNTLQGSRCKEWKKDERRTS